MYIAVDMQWYYNFVINMVRIYIDEIWERNLFYGNVSKYLLIINDIKF